MASPAPSMDALALIRSKLPELEAVLDPNHVEFISPLGDNYSRLLEWADRLVREHGVSHRDACCVAWERCGFAEHNPSKPETYFEVFEGAEGWTYRMVEGETTLMAAAGTWPTKDEAFKECCNAKAHLENMDPASIQIDDA